MCVVHSLKTKLRKGGIAVVMVFVWKAWAGCIKRKTDV